MLRLTGNKRPDPKLSRVRVLVAVPLLVNGIIIFIQSINGNLQHGDAQYSMCVTLQKLRTNSYLQS